MKTYPCIVLLMAAVILSSCESGTSSSNINPLDSSFLHSFTKIQILLNGVFDLEQNSALVRDTGVLFNISNVTSNGGYPAVARIRWNGFGFIVDTSINWSYTGRNETGGGGRSYNYNGGISDNILNIDASYSYGDYLRTHNATIRDIALQSYFEARELRLVEQTDSSVSFGGTLIQNRVDSVHWSSGLTQSGDNMKIFSAFIWDATPAPAVKVTFYR